MNNDWMHPSLIRRALKAYEVKQAKEAHAAAEKVRQERTRQAEQFARAIAELDPSLYERFFIEGEFNATVGLRMPLGAGYYITCTKRGGLQLLLVVPPESEGEKIRYALSLFTATLSDLGRAIHEVQDGPKHKIWYEHPAIPVGEWLANERGV